MVELLNRRTANTKLFDLGNGQKRLMNIRLNSKNDIGVFVSGGVICLQGFVTGLVLIAYRAAAKAASLFEIKRQKLSFYRIDAFVHRHYYPPFNTESKSL